MGYDPLNPVVNYDPTTGEVTDGDTDDVQVGPYSTDGATFPHVVSAGSYMRKARNPGLPGIAGPIVETIAGDSDNPDASTDPTGYDQAQWSYERYLELLEEQRAYNSAEAQLQRDWEERMSNTAVQRQVKDILAAGLNPWLALNGGSVNGASTPSGASATSSLGSVSTPDPKIYTSIISAVTSMFNSASSLLKKFI